MADSTRAIRRARFERELASVYEKRFRHELTPDDLRALCAEIVDLGLYRPSSTCAMPSNKSMVLRCYTVKKSFIGGTGF